MKVTGQSHYLSFIENAASILLLTYPTFMLAVKGGMNGAFLLMLLLAIAAWLKHPAGINSILWKDEWSVYVVSMAALSVAIFVSQSYHQDYSARYYDGPSRYWLAIPVFLFLQRLDLKAIAMLQFAFPAAAIIGFAMANHGKGRDGIGTLDLIHFGDFELMLGMLSLFSIDWFGRDKLLLRAFKLLGYIAGLAASLASGSRGGWLAIPVFVILYIYFNRANSVPRITLTFFIVTILGVGLQYSADSIFHQRLSELSSDIISFNQGNPDTSTGIRLQLYKAATDIFIHNPIFGVGPDGFAREMTRMMEAGKITPMAAELGRGEVHSDILSKTAGMGIFGLVAMLSVYLVPGWLFWKAAKSEFGQVKRTGILGIVFVSGFFVFGLTVETLNLTMAIAFYCFTVAALLAGCNHIDHIGQTDAR